MQPSQTIETGDLYLEQFFAGPMGNCLYLMADRGSGKAVLFDPAFEPVPFLETARERGFEVEAVWCTHAHQDHVGGEIFGMQIPGLRELRAAVDLPVHIHGSELDYLVDKTGQPRDTLHLLEDGQTLELGALRVEVLHLPGHSPGSCGFLVEGHMVVGDTLFVQGVGRVDLPGSDVDAMFHSLQRLKALDGDVHIYPGHHYGPAPSSTIGREVQLNPYLKPASLEQWRAMMGMF